MSAPDSTTPSAPDELRSTRPVAYAGLAVAFVLLCMPLRLDVSSTPYTHIGHIWPWWFGALACCVLAFVHSTPLFRRYALRTFVLVSVYVFLKHPVCVPLDLYIADHPDFARELPQLSREGASYYEQDGHWYQCKSWIGRALFF